MLHWSAVPEEDGEYTAIASGIELTLFAVTKSSTRSRLISWPPVQNDAPQPPYASLPNPAMFESIRIGGSAPGAFFLDISSMFHDITLPMWLARLLPMKFVEFSDLHADTQFRIKKRTTIPHDTENLLLRPCQATMPVGFKWGGLYSPHFRRQLLRGSIPLTQKHQVGPPEHDPRKDAPYLVEQRSPLLLHIIDDAAALTVDWPPTLVTTWHRLTRIILCTNDLPVAEAKSSNPAAVVRDSLNFIGCIWNLKEGIITPSPDRLERVTECAKGLLEASKSNPEAFQRITGKHLGFATLNRPLLACTQAIFHRAKTAYPTAPGPKLPFDESTTAGAVTYPYVAPQLAERLWLAAQRARYTCGRDASDQLQEAQAVQECHSSGLRNRIYIASRFAEFCNELKINKPEKWHMPSISSQMCFFKSPCCLQTTSSSPTTQWRICSPVLTRRPRLPFFNWTPKLEKEQLGVSLRYFRSGYMPICDICFCSHMDLSHHCILN